MLVPQVLTRSDGVDEGSDGAAIVPVLGEVVDGPVGDLALNPAKEALLGRLVDLVRTFLLTLPHGHGDGVVQDERPYQTKDQLQLAVNDVSTVCKGKQRKIPSEYMIFVLSLFFFVLINL